MSVCVGGETRQGVITAPSPKGWGGRWCRGLRAAPCCPVNIPREEGSGRLWREQFPSKSLL